MAEGRCEIPWWCPWECGLKSSSSVYVLSGGVEGSHTKARERVHTINVHGAAAADALSTAAAESQRRVGLVLDPDQGVQHHGARLVQIQRVALHPRLRRGLVRVPAVDVEGLDLGILLGGGLLDGRRLGLGDCRPAGARGLDGGE